MNFMHTCFAVSILIWLVLGVVALIDFVFPKTFSISNVLHTDPKQWYIKSTRTGWFWFKNRSPMEEPEPMDQNLFGIRGVMLYDTYGEAMLHARQLRTYYGLRFDHFANAICQKKVRA